MFSKTRVLFITLLVAFLALGGCQTPPPKGLSPAQIAVLKQQGFELTDEGWAFGLSGKVLFGSDVESLNKASTDIIDPPAQALPAHLTPQAKITQQLRFIFIGLKHWQGLGSTE